MSLTDHEGGEIIRLPGIWEVLAKFAFASAIPVLMLGVGWAVWITQRSNEHDIEIAVLKSQLSQRMHGISSQIDKAESGHGIANEEN